MVEIDFGDTLAITYDSAIAPTLPSAVTPATATTADIELAVTWQDGTNGKWSELFQFKTDSTDLANASATDINMKVDTAQFYSGNFIEQAGTISSGGTDGKTMMADEYVCWTAFEIFGITGRADMFDNEEELVTHVKNQHSNNGVADKDDILTLLKSKLSDSTHLTNQNNTNAAWLVMSKLINATDTNERAGGRFDDAQLSEDTNNTGYYHMPLKAGDTLTFKVGFNEVTAATHGIGNNAVRARSYKVVLTLA